MKYLNKHDFIEIGLIALVVIGALLAVAVIAIGAYYADRVNPIGCIPHAAV